MLAFFHATAAGRPVYLCEDLRREIHRCSKMRLCQRCGGVVSTGSGRDRVRMCYTPQHGLICFTCHHRVRWPRP